MKKVLIFLALLSVILFIVIFVIRDSLGRKETGILISGRVEADEILLSPEIPGRITEIYVKEGRKIGKGEPVARLDERELKAKRERILSEIRATESRLQSAELSLEYLRQRISRGIEEAGQLLSIARAREEKARATLEREESRYRRYLALRGKGVVPKDRFEDIKLSRDLAITTLREAREERKRAEIRLTLAENERRLIPEKESEIEGLRHSLNSIRAVLNEIDIQLTHTTIKAPRDGIILKKVVQPGEVIGRGGVIATMIDPASIFVKSYLPEPDLGRVRIGTTVGITTDSHPDRKIQGYICHISEEAEFTPREVQSRQERIKQVFELKVCFREGTEGIESLKKGMPVDLMILPETENRK